MPDAMTAPVHHRIPDPVFRWPTSGWWFTAIGVLMGAVLLLAPSSIQLSLLRRLLLCLALILAPAVLIVLFHTWRCLAAAVLRARGYSALVTSLDEANCGLDRAHAVINALVRERQERSSLRIAYCYVFDDKPMIGLKRKRGFRVKVGDLLTVVAEDLGRILGTFEVTEDGGDQYLARSCGDMDPLWHGHMKQVGAARSEPPPHALAMRLSVEEDADDTEKTESTT